jgi:hypothetical protein
MIGKLKQFIRESNPLEAVGPELFNFATKRILPAETANDIMQSIEAGSKAYQLFIQERVIGDLGKK